MTEQPVEIDSLLNVALHKTKFDLSTFLESTGTVRNSQHYKKKKNGRYGFYRTNAKLRLAVYNLEYTCIMRARTFYNDVTIVLV